MMTARKLKKLESLTAILFYLVSGNKLLTIKQSAKTMQVLVMCTIVSAMHLFSRVHMIRGSWMKTPVLGFAQYLGRMTVYGNGMKI